MPGYGHSAPIEPYTFKGLAQSCITLIESLQVRRRARLLGHSMGGMVAQEVVARRPELVSRLILCGTSAVLRQARRRLAARIHRRSAPRRWTPARAWPSWRRCWCRRWSGPGSLPEGVRLATHCMARCPASTYRRALEALVTFDRRANLPQIHVPTLLVAGEHDRNAPPAVMKKMADAITGSTYLEMHGIGHLQNLEAPGRLRRAGAEFPGAAARAAALTPNRGPSWTLARTELHARRRRPARSRRSSARCCAGATSWAAPVRGRAPRSGTRPRAFPSPTTTTCARPACSRCACPSRTAAWAPTTPPT